MMCGLLNRRLSGMAYQMCVAPHTRFSDNAFDRRPNVKIRKEEKKHHSIRREGNEEKWKNKQIDRISGGECVRSVWWNFHFCQIYLGGSVGVDCKRFIIFIRKSLGERELELLEMNLSVSASFGRLFYLFFIFALSQRHPTWWRILVWCEPEHLREKGYGMDKTEITRCRYATRSTLSAFPFKEIQRMSSIFYSEWKTTMQWSGGRHAETDTQSKQRNGEHLLADTTG